MCGIVGYVGSPRGDPDPDGRPEAPGVPRATTPPEWRVAERCRRAAWSRNGRARSGRSKQAIDEASSPSRKLRNRAHPVGDTRRAERDRTRTRTRLDDGDIALVHNGIIENADVLRAQLKKRRVADGLHRLDRDGHRGGRTAHRLPVARRASPLENAVAAALRQVDGAYGIAVISSRRDPGKIVVARNGSPLLVGVGHERRDARGLGRRGGDRGARATSCIWPTGTTPCSRPTGTAPTDLEGTRRLTRWRARGDVGPRFAIEKGGYEHFMLKEIFEQPSSLRRDSGPSPCGGG